MSLNTFPCNPYPISTEELNKGNNDELNTRVSALETAVEEIDNDKADLGVIAAEFDAEAGTYEIGDLVTNEGKLYEFTGDHSTSGAWDPTEVTEKTVADEVNFVKSGLTNVGAYNATPVKVGTWLGNDLYRVVKDVGALPNSTSKVVDVGIVNRAQVVSMRGFAYGVDGHIIPIPFVSANQTVDRIEISYSRASGQLQIVTTMDVSTYGGYVVFDYYIIS